MAHFKAPLTKKASKKNNKEVKAPRGSSALKNPELEAMTAKELLKRYPKRVVKKGREILTALKQKITSKGKKPMKVSKRTSGRHVGSNTDNAPAHVNVEGARWLKTEIKQNLSQRKTLDKKLQKRKK